MRILLIRHGETPENVLGELGTTVPGPSLTELGEQQAAAIPRMLAAHPIEAIYVSTMQRTHLTAAPLARASGLQAQVIDGIEEIAAGDLESRSDPESHRMYWRAVFSWWQSFDTRVPGGENGHEFFGRFDTAIAAIAERHEGTVAIVSHGAAIRAWTSWTSSNIDEAFSRDHELENTALVVLDGSPGAGWVVSSWGGTPVAGPSGDDDDTADPIAQPA